MVMPSFDELPDEIVVKILCLVTSAPSVLNCRLVNQRLRSCIDSSSSIQYSVMLDAWGYENIISGTPLRDIPSEKLKALEKHQKSWALLDWKEHRTSIPFSRTYHVSQGFLYAPSQDNSIICITLPSRLTGQTLMSQKLHHVFDFEIAALASDPSQGLLAVVELSQQDESIKVHFRRLSEDRLDVGAFATSITVGKGFEIEVMPTCRIFGSVIGVTWGSSNPAASASSFALVQWVSGKILLSRFQLDTDYVFLNEYSLLNLSRESSQVRYLEVWTVDDQTLEGRLSGRFLVPTEGYTGASLCSPDASATTITWHDHSLKSPVYNSVPPFQPSPESEFVALILSNPAMIFFSKTRNIFAPKAVFLQKFHGYEDAEAPVPFSIWSSQPLCSEMSNMCSNLRAGPFLSGARFLTLNDKHLQVWDLMKARAHLVSDIQSERTRDPKSPTVVCYVRPLSDINLPTNEYLIFDTIIDHERIILVAVPQQSDADISDVRLEVAILEI